MVDNTPPGSKSSVVDQRELASAEFDDSAARKIGDSAGNELLPNFSSSFGDAMQIKIRSGEKTLLELNGGTAVLNDAVVKGAPDEPIIIEGNRFPLKFTAFIKHLSIPSAGCDDSRVTEAGGVASLARGGDA